MSKLSKIDLEMFRSEKRWEFAGKVLEVMKWLVIAWLITDAIEDIASH